MEFWGVEVKAGEPLKVKPGEDKVLHLSQASLGEVKKDKGNESIPLFVKINGQKIVIGTLSPEKCNNISYDLVFEKDFELSHNWKNGSVYFCGYISVLPDDSPDEFTDSDSDSGEELPVDVKENGKPKPKEEQAKPTTDKASAAKPDSFVAKPKVKIVEPSKDDKSKEDDDEEDDSDDDEEDDSVDEDMLLAAGAESDDDDSSGEDDDSSDEDEEATPKKAHPGKKRPAESAIKTPAPEKKAKLVTPQKTGPDGKKGGGHIATPYPSKKAGKTPANSDKSKQQTPKSAGQVACKTCSKTFNSDNALQSHTKAKHSGEK